MEQRGPHAPAAHMPSAPSYAQVLRLPGLRGLLVAALCSRLAEQAFSLALVLFVLQRLGSPEVAGVAVFASIAPGLVASPIAGALLDRRGAARLVGLDMAASAVLIGAVVALDALRLLGVVPLLVLVALFSLTTPLGLAGTRALIPRLAPAAALDRANALDTTVWSVVALLGPLAVGVLFGLLGGRPTLAVIAGLYLVGWLVLRTAGLRATEDGVGDDTGGRLRDVLAAATLGVRYVVAHPTLRGIAAAYALYQLCWGVLGVAVPVIAVDAVGEPRDAAPVVGLLWAASGLATGAAALLGGHRGTADRERRIIAIGATGTGIAVLLVVPLGLVPLGLVPLAVALLVVGGLAGVVDLAVLALRQRRTDPSLLGRVLAVSISLNVSGAPVGAAVGGLLLAHSVPLALVAAGVAAIAGGAAALLLIPGSEGRR